MHVRVLTLPLDPEGGVVVLDTTRLRADQGYAWWSWLGRTKTEAEAAERLFRLLGDPSLPTTERSRLEEAIMEGELQTTRTEREGLYQRLQREIREGQEAGLREGRKEGRREALLRLVASVAPDDLPAFRAIDDVDALEQAVTERVLRGR